MHIDYSAILETKDSAAKLLQRWAGKMADAATPDNVYYRLRVEVRPITAEEESRFRSLPYPPVVGGVAR